MTRNIDVTFDFRSDTPGEKDPDTFSPTLRRYHKYLWSKSLPSGVVFELDDASHAYLYHQSRLGEFFLSSDSVIPTFARARSISHIIGQIPPQEREAFHRKGYTIGGMMVFPRNRIDGKITINGARGFHPRIKDRFDLTVECIRRHYLNQSSPLSDTLARYADFFALFSDFRGYVEFFLLQDLVSDDFAVIKPFLPFLDFTTSPLPASMDAYKTYRRRAVDFIDARNRRIETLAQAVIAAR